MTSPNQHFSLRWNNYSNHITNAFDSLRSQEDLVDVTLCCEGRKIRAHKVLLSACSFYFRDVFKENPCQHPVIVFKNVKYEDLLALIEFMYQGEVSVQQDSLPSFLTTAEMLAVQGLTVSNDVPAKDLHSSTTFSSSVAGGSFVQQSLGTTSNLPPPVSTAIPAKMLPNISDLKPNTYSLVPVSIASIQDTITPNQQQQQQPLIIAAAKLRTITTSLSTAGDNHQEVIPIKKRRISEDDNTVIEEPGYTDSAEDMCQQGDVSITEEDDEEDTKSIQLVSNQCGYANILEPMKIWTATKSNTNTNGFAARPVSLPLMHDKKEWSHNEICYLLGLYETRMHSLQYEACKNHFWEIMAELMQSRGFNRNEQECREKWKSLCRDIRLMECNDSNENIYANQIKRVLNTFTTQCLETVRSPAGQQRFFVPQQQQSSPPEIMRLNIVDDSFDEIMV